MKVLGGLNVCVAYRDMTLMMTVPTRTTLLNTCWQLGKIRLVAVDYKHFVTTGFLYEFLTTVFLYKFLTTVFWYILFLYTLIIPCPIHANMLSCQEALKAS